MPRQIAVHYSGGSENGLAKPICGKSPFKDESLSVGESDVTCKKCKQTQLWRELFPDQAAEKTPGRKKIKTGTRVTVTFVLTDKAVEWLNAQEIKGDAIAQLVENYMESQDNL